MLADMYNATSSLKNCRGIRTTCEFHSKIFDHEGPSKHLWCSDPLNDYGFDEEQLSFFADSVAVSLSKDGTSYSIKSAVNEASIVNITVTRTSPGFQVGKDGTSYFGTDHSNPWGSMRHAFWPRCQVTGTIKTPAKVYDMKGKGLFIHALQGMKPHHAAAKWNFVNFQTATYSALMMEFITPPSYGRTSVNVAGIVKDGEIVCGGASSTIKHLATSQDSENDWPEPKAVLCEWRGRTSDGTEVKAEVMGELGDRKDRIDVLSHIPGFVKTIVGGVVGTKPYIYQVGRTAHVKFPFLTFRSTYPRINLTSRSRLERKKPANQVGYSLKQHSFHDTCNSRTTILLGVVGGVGPR